MSEATESAVEAKEKDRTVALIVAILALLLALAEAGAKNAQHLSTEKNIKSSDLFNFYQAKKIRSTVVEAASQMLEAQKTAVDDPNAKDAFEAQIQDFKATVARFEKDPKQPEDSLEAIQERAKAAAERRETANRRLAHYELGSGLIQIDRARLRRDYHRDHGADLVQRWPGRDRRRPDGLRLPRPDRVDGDRLTSVGAPAMADPLAVAVSARGPRTATMPGLPGTRANM